MKIGGFHPASFIDYPGRVAAVIFTQGCNFRCPYCHNAGLIDPARPAAYDTEEIVARLASRRDKLGGVVISGGEPTIQEDLLPFCRRLRELGLAVKLDTNGSRPEVIEQLLAAGAVDYIAMDLKAPLEHYQRLAGVPVAGEKIRRSIALIAAGGIPHHFRTTHFTRLLNAADLETVQHQLVPAGSPYKVQPFKEPLVKPGVMA